MKRLTLFALAASSLALNACDTGSNAIMDTKAPAPSFDTTAMDSLLSNSVERGDVIGVSALVFDEGHIVYKGAFGLRDRERKLPVELDTVFRIYSMTKPITSVIIMDLIEEGKLSLSDPASKYIPELADMQVASLDKQGQAKFEPQANPMTIEDLLLHRAGLGYGIFGPVNPIAKAYMDAELFQPKQSVEAMVGKITQLPLMQQPGQAWYYSLSIDVLGRIAEIIEGQSLENIMSARIFAPLDMTETSFTVRPEQKPRFASNYALTPEGFVLEDDAQKSGFTEQDNQFQSGGGGLVSTLGDYAKFAQMMLDGGVYQGHRVLEEDTVSLMMMPHMNADDSYLFPWLGGDTLTGFGYGGSVVYADSEMNKNVKGQAIGQWGWSGAARTNFYIDPENNAFGIIMLQMFSAEDPVIHDSYQALAYENTRNDR